MNSQKLESKTKKLTNWSVFNPAWEKQQILREERGKRRDIKLTKPCLKVSYKNKLGDSEGE
ncbi:hypothetical protein CH361_07735 [Leptospira brenneri]|nr:hypothetical protein CH361_07735 [Leptospira brenneri]